MRSDELTDILHPENRLLTLVRSLEVERDTLRDALSWEVQARDRFAELAVRLEEREKLLAARGAEWATRAKAAEGLLREMASQRQCHSARCAMWVDEVYLCTCWLVDYMVPQEVAEYIDSEDDYDG